MTETIESLDKRVSDIDARIDVIINSLSIILQQFNTIEHKNTELRDLLQRNSEFLRNDVEYLEVGEIY
jgi:prefoldin subunit 5